MFFCLNNVFEKKFFKMRGSYIKITNTSWIHLLIVSVLLKNTCFRPLCSKSFTEIQCFIDKDYFSIKSI